MITLIAAFADQLAIGHQQQLLCHLPADLKHFKTLTSGHTVVMGRKTFESLPKGALPNRTNIILSHQSDVSYPGAIVVHSLQEALEKAPAGDEVFIIGGATVYREAMPFAERMELTQIHHQFKEADTFLPQWNEQEWQITTREAHQADEKNPFDYTFLSFERKRK